MPLLFEQGTHLLRRCYFEVQNEVGLGRHEEAYHHACVLWFDEYRVPVGSKMPHRLLLRGEEAHPLFPDLVVSALFDTNEFNVNHARSYLKALGLSWGVAADFGKWRAEIIGIRQQREGPRMAWQYHG